MAADPSQVSSPPYRRWIHLLCVAFVLVTFLVLNRGGQVTSRGAGLAVPDFPRVYGHNMIFYPVALWRGGIYWEHTHRLVAAMGGCMAIVVAYVFRSTQRHRPWLQWYGVALLAAYITQGLMGGYRVTELSVVAAMAHGVLGQLILCGTVIAAAATSRHWIDGPKRGEASRSGKTLLQRRCSLLLAALLLQLVLGVFVRHGGAALAIPDFPLAYGALVPPFAAEVIETEYDERVPYDADHAGIYPTTLQVAVHWSHRLGAILVIVAATWTLLGVYRHAATVSAIVKPAITVALLVVPQAVLGAWVVLSGHQVDTATVHHAVGAALLAVAVLLLIRVSLLLPSPDRPVPTFP